MMIADEINADKTGLFKNFIFSDDELDELYVSGWLHDFGKVATPEHIMGKSTKLEGLYDKIDEINEANTLFESLLGDVVEGRRKFIQENSLKVSNLYI